MRNKKVTQAQFQAETYNPLLMWRGCNGIPAERLDRHTEDVSFALKFYEEFVTLYNKAIKQAPSKHICFGLEVDYADTDEGLGGFYDAGFVPVGLFDNIDGNVEKYMNYAWPRDPFSADGKFMRYLGGINLGIWPKVFHDMTASWGEHLRNGKSFAMGVRDSNSDLGSIRSKNTWLHLFSSRQAEFDSPTPDCNVQMSHEHDFSRMDENTAKIVRDVYKNKHWTPEQIREHIINWQTKHTEEAEFIKGHKKYFKNIRPRFYYDGPYSDKIYKLMDNEKGIFAHGKGDCNVYGKPNSQQEPQRYISPNSYNGIRALTPTFCFNDADHDMTHQFYCDTLMLDEFNHKQAYCKLDSSCT